MSGLCGLLYRNLFTTIMYCTYWGVETNWFFLEMQGLFCDPKIIWRNRVQLSLIFCLSCRFSFYLPTRNRLQGQNKRDKMLILHECNSF